MIPFLDLKRQNKTLKRQLSRAIKNVFNESMFVGGSAVNRFEKEFARFCAKKYCVGINSGTDALFLALLAYNIGPGDEVITAPNSYFSGAAVITNVGATAVFVDVDSISANIDTTKIEKAITKKTKAIIPVHLYGQSADMDPIVALAKKYHLHIIEDCCQAHGAKYKGKIVPYSETGAFSFYPGKNLGAFGDAGAVVTDNSEIADRLLRLRNDGSTKKYIHKSFGYKSRLDTLQAAILSLKLPYLKMWNGHRRRLARLYEKLLKDIPQVTIPKEMPYSYHIYHLYMIQCQNRDGLQDYLVKHDIKTIIHYPTSIHLQKPYRQLGFHAGMFPVTEKRSKMVLSLPMFPELTDQEVTTVCKRIREFYERAEPQ